MATNEKDKKHDASLKDKLNEEIEELREEANLPNDFPLSGGTGPHTVHDHHLADEDTDEEKDDKK